MLSEYKFKTEFHAHTNPASPCGDFPPEEVVKKYADAGFDSIMISNHIYPEMKYIGEREKCINAYLDDYYRSIEAGKKYGITVVLGCEIRITDTYNDYLLFGIDEEIVAQCYDHIDTTIEEFSKWFRGEGRVLIHAHPFRENAVLVNPDFIDGIEVFNMHPNHNSRVAVAAKYAEKHNLLITAGTDFHHYGHEGMVATLTKTKMETSADVAKILKEKDYVFQLGNSIILPYGV